MSQSNELLNRINERYSHMEQGTEDAVYLYHG